MIVLKPKTVPPRDWSQTKLKLASNRWLSFKSEPWNFGMISLKSGKRWQVRGVYSPRISWCSKPKQNYLYLISCSFSPFCSRAVNSDNIFCGDNRKGWWRMESWRCIYSGFINAKRKDMSPQAGRHGRLAQVGSQTRKNHSKLKKLITFKPLGDFGWVIARRKDKIILYNMV